MQDVLVVEDADVGEGMEEPVEVLCDEVETVKGILLFRRQAEC